MLPFERKAKDLDRKAVAFLTRGELDHVPLLDYKQLYRHWADPDDELFSSPVCEEETREPAASMVVY
jgi:hypothetical protein